MSHTIEKGKLYQYKADHYGKVYPEQPTKMCSDGFIHLGMSASRMWHRAESKVLKFTLFVTKVVTLKHPLAPLYTCTYVACLISDPYNEGDTQEKWVRADWLEPLTPFQSYQAETLSVARKLFEKMKARDKELEKNE